MLHNKLKNPPTPKIKHKSTSNRHQHTTKRNITSHNATKSEKTPPKRGKITLILGPMFSGKSSLLLEQLHEHQQKYIDNLDNKSLLIKHSSDNRYNGDSEVVTHTNKRHKAIAVPCLDHPEIMNQIHDKKHIFIDEGQFFPDLAPLSDKFARSGKNVIISALDGTFKRELFPSIAQMIPLSDEITKLSASCHSCGADAPFSKRLIDDDNIHLIGGADTYQAACRDCYHI